MCIHELFFYITAENVAEEESAFDVGVFKISFQDECDELCYEENAYKKIRK